MFFGAVPRKPFKNVVNCWYCVHRGDSGIISLSFTVECSTVARLFACMCDEEFRGSEAE
jgi:hypothetical protein